MRKMKSTANLDSVDKRIFLLYNEKVYYPFIAKIREKDYRLGEGQAVPEELKTVAWCDGGMPQLQAIISESLEEQDKTSNIERDKHAASASAVQQPADIQALFRSLKQLQKITSASDTYNADLADFIADVLKHQTALSLETKKMKAVLDFLGCLPSMLSKLCLAKHVTPGFTEAGMIDERSKQYPDVEKMINTCKRMDIDKMGIFWKHFDELFKCAMEHGMVTEDILNKLGIPDDLDATGKVIKRDAGITQEHLQRAKSLSHAHQSMLRKEKQQMILDTLKTKLSTKKSCIQTYIDGNKECEKKIYQEMKLDEDTYDASYLAHASPQLFSKCTMKQLKAFIHCRKSKDEKKYPDKIPNLKANYVAAAWDLRTSPIIIKLPTQAEENEYLHAKKLNPQVTHVTALRHAVYQQSSITLRNVRLVLYVHNNYRGANFLEHTDVDIQHHDQADCLTRMLGGRLESHIVRKIATNQHDHYCLRLMKDNLATLAAMVVLAQHVQVDVETCGMTDCLLNHPNYGMDDKYKPLIGEMLDTIGTDSGCYLYYNNNRKKWIRSGKVSRRPISARLEEHKKAAENVGGTSEASSKMYNLYPSRNSALVRNNSGSKSWKGYFEDLIPYAGITYKWSSHHNIKELVDTEFLNWTSLPKDNFDSAQKLGHDLISKKMTLLSYMLELVYDLMLAPADNLSTQPGFESAGLYQKH